MTVDEFINGYKNAIDKPKYCEKHIVTRYVPYEQKINYCMTILDASQGNSPFQTVLFALKYIEAHYDIQFVNYNYAVYDQFEEIEAINVLMNSIGANEYATWKALLGMIEFDRQGTNYEKKN